MTQDDIPVEVDEEESDDYKDDEFASSNSSAALAKASASKSGRLPPLSSSYPHGATEKSLSQSFVNASKDKESKVSNSQNKDQVSSVLPFA